MNKRPLIFLFTSGGVIGFFLLYSILTEYRFNKTYDGKKFKFTCTMNGIFYLLVVVQAIIMKIIKKERFHTVFSRDIMQVKKFI